MTEHREATLTATEAEVMNIIWEKAPAGVPDIVERLPRDLAYTTVMTIVRILEEKGFVQRCGKRGRAYLYQPCVERRTVRGSMTQQLADRLFGGSLKTLVLSLVQDEAIDKRDLAEVRAIIENLENQK